MYDFILKGGTVVDGTGQKAYAADLAVRDGKIAAVGLGLNDRQAKILDVTGLVTAPGFIDIHSHSDTSFLNDERCESKLYQGVTSEVAGQCGASMFPCLEDRLAHLTEADASEERAFTSTSFAQFRARVAQAGRRMSTNLISLVGHGALRAGVLGYENRPATAAELAAMASLLERDLQDGAWGLSLGLGYTPGVSADVNELIALGRVVARYNGHIPAHMRDQSDKTPQSLDEMYAINRGSGARVHIAHFKAGGKANFGRGPEFARHVTRAQQSGVAVTVDVYPYTAASSGITNSFPKWSIQGGLEQTLLRLQTEERASIYTFLSQAFCTREDGESLYIVSTNGRFPQADDKDIWQLSQELGLSMAETILTVTEQTRARAVCISHSMSQGDVDFFLAQADYAIGSDGRALPFDPAANKGKPHPRNFGTFPRFLRQAREQGFASLETAIHRISKLPADIVGLSDRGLIKPGFVADITIFCPQTIADRATYKDPFQKPVGIEHVFVAGRPALLHGQQTEMRLGNFLLRS